MRLSGRSAFAGVFAARCSAGDARIRIFARPNDLSFSRLGLSVSKRHGGSVQRNKIKRLMREAFRVARDQIPGGFDIVVIPLAGGAHTLDALKQSLISVTRRAVRELERRTRPT